MKTLITLTIATIICFFAGVKANAGEEYNKAVIGHVIQSKVNGTNVDVNSLLEQEMEKIAHQFALESLTILQKYLPAILDGVITEMRLEADKDYKCSLLHGTKAVDKDCK